MNSGSSKYAIILLVMFLGFAFLVSNAFKYLPSEKNKNAQQETSVEATDTRSESENEDNYTSEERTSDYEETQYEEREDVAAAADITEYSSEYEDRTIDDIQNEAKMYKETRQYAKAATAYKAVIAKSDDMEAKAKGYEDLATLYAVAGKYKTALSLAQKANNVSPSTSRELLIARLYYKSGDMNRAKERMENILRSDFDR